MFRVRQRVGKYQVEKRLGEGGTSVVYQALDTVEGVRVALKVPHAKLVTPQLLEDFRREARLIAPLRHPNILQLKNADFINDHFILAFPLGQQSLADRLRKRMSATQVLDYCEQLLAGLAHAHESRIVHCDVKPENLILFPEGSLRLTDFGIAKVSLRTIQGSGSGTLGHMAPEQAMGKPSYRSDVFSAGLTIWRLLSGEWLEWPFAWPYAGHARAKKKFGKELCDIVRRSLEIEPRKRYRDATQMLAAFKVAKRRTLGA